VDAKRAPRIQAEASGRHDIPSPQYILMAAVFHTCTMSEARP
jgi:hypothetical protein